jgi:hypothetical protein
MVKTRPGQLVSIGDLEASAVVADMVYQPTLPLFPCTGGKTSPALLAAASAGGYAHGLVTGGLWAR